MQLRKKDVLYEYVHNLFTTYLCENIPYTTFLSELLCCSAKVLNAQYSAIYTTSESGIIEGDLEADELCMYMSKKDFCHEKVDSFSCDKETVASHALSSGRLLNLDQEELHTNYEMDIYRPVTVFSSMAALTRGIGASRGIAEMINKRDNAKFTTEDQELFKNILLYSDFALTCSKLKEETAKLDASLHYRNDTLLRLMEPCRHDQILYRTLDIKWSPDLYSISFIPAESDHITFCKLINKMLMDTLQRWNTLPPDVRIRFLLTVHRATTYHHFSKIFCAVHFIAIIINSCAGVFSQLEKELLMYSALCHGVNASDPLKGLKEPTDLEAFPLDVDASEYSTSFYYIKLIFMNCKIFNDRAETETMVKKMNKLMEACSHQRTAGKDDRLLGLFMDGSFDMHKQRHRHLLRICVMVVAGYGLYFKPVELIIELAMMKKLTSENILEKEVQDADKNGGRPARVKLAESQLHLLNTVVLPWVVALRTVLPQVAPVIFRLLDERENWDRICSGHLHKEFWLPDKVSLPDGRTRQLLHFLDSDKKLDFEQPSGNTIEK